MNGLGSWVPCTSVGPFVLSGVRASADLGTRCSHTGAVSPQPQASLRALRSPQQE